MKRITRGFTRTVFLFRDYAIKLPCCRYGWRIFLTGLLCNIQERRFWTARWPELCPVLWSDRLGFVIIMPRLQILGREMTDEEFAAFSDKPDYRIPVENKPDSFGWWQGRIVAVDYGS